MASLSLHMSKLCARLAQLQLIIALAGNYAAAAPESFALLHSLFDPSTNAQAYAGQGFTVAVDGNLAVVGAPYDDVGALNSGVVKVYDATTGTLLHTLTNPSPAAYAGFGACVAVSGTLVVVGWAGTSPAFVYDLAGPTPTVPLSTLINPGSVADDYFGSAVAISGTRVVVGAFQNDAGKRDAGSAYVYELTGASFLAPSLTLTNPGPGRGDNFGYAVAISGTRVVVGAINDNAGASQSGSAYVYELASATPLVPSLTLTNPSPETYDYFGSALAISGTRVVVGVPYDDHGETNSGSAYVYDLAGATPGVPVLTLTNPSPAVLGYFARSVALSGTRLVVGSHAGDTYAFDAGRAYVYDLAGATPSAPLLTITNSNPAAHDVYNLWSHGFGYSVALSGTRLVVGAPGDDAAASQAGGAYVYDLASATPAVPLAVLNRGSIASQDNFGQSVAVSGKLVVVGAPQTDTGAPSAGSAYLYDLSSAVPNVPVLTLTNPTPAFGDEFGWSVAVSGSRVLVGAVSDRIGGSVHVYDLASPTPAAPFLTLTNPSPADAEHFGAAVALAGTRVAVGAPFEHAGLYQVGRAYVYDLASPTPTAPVLTMLNPSPAAEDTFGGDVAILGARVLVGAARDDTGAINAGSAYLYDLSSPTPTAPFLALTNPSPATDDYFGSSVAFSGSKAVIGAIGKDTGATNAGVVYVFDLASPTPTVPVHMLTNPAPAFSGYFGGAVASSGPRIVVGAPYNGTSPLYAGNLYVYDLGSATPAAPLAALAKANPAAGDQFGYSVAIDGTTIVAGASGDDAMAADRGAAYVFGLRPVLSIVPVAPGFATISWSPAMSSGFVLQHTESLAPTSWVNAPSGAANPVTISTGNASRFYRLFQP